MMITHRITSESTRSTQKGAALVIALILLTIITLLSISAMQSSILNTRIATNHQFKEMSFQAAENALAKVTAPNPEVQVPNVGATIATPNPNYFDSDDENNLNQTPRLRANLNMGYVCHIGQGQSLPDSDCASSVLISGFPPDSGYISYLPTATGYVGGAITHAQSTTRSQVVQMTQ
ncbi:MAG: PilX N-terminal domain-containing pilus assembly protein [Candidatus Thiodiazotropha sp.]|jgi:type IV pilus assembly protein PilX